MRRRVPAPDDHDRARPTSRFAKSTGLYQVRKYLFPWVELVMVHKQFRTFKKLAEKMASEGPSEEAGNARIDRSR